MEIFASGLSMGESPRWHDGRLWVCDWMAGEVLSFDAAGDRRVELTMEGLPFSIDWLPDGRAVLTSPSGVVLGDGTPYGGTGRGWNEIVVDGHGNTFVNEIGFDFMGGEEPTPGTVHVVRPDGSTRQVADDVWFPNGMALTRDGTTLIVAESYRNRLYGVRRRRPTAASRTGASGRSSTFAPDGICVDADGAVWYATVPGRCCIRVAEGGEVLDRVDADRGCFACMLGGDDGRTLLRHRPGVGRRRGRRRPHRPGADPPRAGAARGPAVGGLIAYGGGRGRAGARCGQVWRGGEFPRSLGILRASRIHGVSPHDGGGHFPISAVTSHRVCARGSARKPRYLGNSPPPHAHRPPYLRVSLKAPFGTTSRLTAASSADPAQTAQTTR